MSGPRRNVAYRTTIVWKLNANIDLYTRTNCKDRVASFKNVMAKERIMVRSSVMWADRRCFGTVMLAKVESTQREFQPVRERQRQTKAKREGQRVRELTCSTIDRFSSRRPEDSKITDDVLWHLFLYVNNNNYCFIIYISMAIGVV